MSFPSNFNLATLDGINGFELNGLNALNDGLSVASGNFNGDAFDDLIIGAPNTGPNGTIYVVLGGASITSPFDLSVLNNNIDTNSFELNGVAAGDHAGFSVASGDVNHDGFGDLVIGAPNANTVYVVYGSSILPTSPIDLSSATAILSGGAPGDMTGSSVATVTTQFSSTDLIIGAPDAGNDAGAVYVVAGPLLPGQHVDLSSLIGTNGFELSGLAAGDYFGSSVASGDLNGDGSNDLIIGAPDAGNGAGAVYAVYGTSSHQRALTQTLICRTSAPPTASS
jgi:hypothetical protein